MPRKRKVRTFNDALRALEARTSGGAMKVTELLRGEIQHMRPYLDEASRKLHVVQDKAIEASRDAAKAVDEDAHKRPWFYVGIIAGLSVILGFLLGRGSRR